MLEPDPLVETGGVHQLATALEHRLADVDPDDVGLRRASQRDGDAGGPRRHVQDPPRLKAREVADDFAPPPPVLAKRQNPGEAVVARRQVLEETRGEGVLGARSRWTGIRHGPLQGTGTRTGLCVLFSMGRSARSRLLFLAAVLAFSSLRPPPAPGPPPPLPPSRPPP